MTNTEKFLLLYSIITTLKIIFMFLFIRGIEKEVQRLDEEGRALSERVFDLYKLVKKTGKQ